MWYNGSISNQYANCSRSIVATDQCGQQGIKTTSLLSKANLSHSRLEKFVGNLTGAGLVNKIE